MEFVTNTIGGMIFQSIVLHQEDKPDDFVIKMLTNNEIEGLLKMSVLRKNNDIEVRYNVTSLVPLAQFITNQLSKKKVLTLLKSIVSTTIQVEEYMLDQKSIALDVDKIYVDITNGKAYLMIIPTMLYQGVDVVPFEKQLITGLQFDPSEDSSYILGFMNAFNNGSIGSVVELEKFIDSVENMNSEKKPISNSKVTDAKDFLIPGGYEKERPLERNKPIEPKEIMKMGGYEREVASGNAPQIVVPSGGVEIKEDINESKKKNGKGIFGNKPTEKKEKQKSKLFGKKNTTNTAMQNMGFAVPGMDPMPGAAILKEPEIGQTPIQTPVQTPIQTPVQTPIQTPIQTPVQTPLKDKPVVKVHQPLDYGNTIMVNQNNMAMTVMLDEDYYGESGTVAASIIRVSNGQKMYIEKDILKMGKESDYVDFYIGNNPTISRSHADILKKDDGYYIRDNNAKNHTYINGEMIVPGQLVKLENNDEIKLSNEVFKFRLS